MSQAIKIKSLTKSFGAIRAVRNVSFNVSHGEVLGFLGPNGAGKSTTMKMITGFPLSVKRSIGYLPEGAPAYGEMTVRNFLNFIADIRQLNGAIRKKRLDEVIETINIGTVIDQSIETLSKGFKRRVGLAQAILHDPNILILDEPTDGLDPNQKHEVRNLIKKMSMEKAIIISTHILEEVDAVCTRAIIISSGELLFDGTPTQLIAKSDQNDIDHAFRNITISNSTKP